MDCLTTSDLSNPEEIAISKESTEIFKQKIDTLLSDFEKQVLIMFLNGDSYASIAGTLNKDPKAIDNALQRVKKTQECLISIPEFQGFRFFIEYKRNIVFQTINYFYSTIRKILKVFRFL